MTNLCRANAAHHCVDRSLSWGTSTGCGTGSVGDCCDLCREMEEQIQP